jgi:hypothetical protein
VNPTPAAAGSGWYLIAPPSSSTEERPEIWESAPIRDWRQLGSFDTADQCEASRRVTSESATLKVEAWRHLPADAEPHRRRSDNSLFAMAFANALHLRCIASDDPRLSQGPSLSPVPPAPPPPPVQRLPASGAFNAAVSACRSIVRQETNSSFAEINTVYAKLGLGPIQSKFEVYVRPDGGVSLLGTETESFSFEKCMNDRGSPIR